MEIMVHGPATNTRRVIPPAHTRAMPLTGNKPTWLYENFGNLLGPFFIWRPIKYPGDIGLHE